jgi:hypothetical protein
MFYWDLVVARLQINIIEVFGPDDLIKEVVDSRNRVPASDCDFIRSLVINAKSPGPIFFLHQYDWDPTRRWVGMYFPLVEQFLDLPLDLLVL